MTPDLLDLARELVALPGWEWRPGMRVALMAGRGGCARIVVAPNAEVEAGGGPVEVEDGDLPDLSDPATLGALLGLVRERLVDPLLGLYPVRMVDCPPWWNVANVWGTFGGTGPTEAAALVAALRAAGRRS